MPARIVAMLLISDCVKDTITDQGIKGSCFDLLTRNLVLSSATRIKGAKENLICVIREISGEKNEKALCNKQRTMKLIYT